MPTNRCSPRLQFWVRGYILLLLAALLAIGVHLTRVGRNWPLGDWLINYEGGFVRRGLMGQLCLRTGHLLHLDPLYIAAGIGMLGYALVFYAVWHLLARSSWRWWVMVLLVSPCTLAFPVLVSRGGYRKETLFFAGLAGLILLLEWLHGRRGGDMVLAVYLTGVSATLILSHEPLAAYLTYYLAALAIRVRDPKRFLRICCVPALVSVLTIYAVLRHTGDAQIVGAICRSVGANSHNVCSDAILFLAQDQQGAQSMVLVIAHQYHYFLLYPVLTLLALAPFVAAFRDLIGDNKQRRIEVRLVLAAAVLALIASIELFRYGTDWGRWIQIHVFSLFLLVLMMDSRSKLEAVPAAPRQNLSTGRLAFAALVVAYATCWSLPWFGDTPLFGYLEFAARAVGHGRG